jgi:Tocopherol cyclase
MKTLFFIISFILWITSYTSALMVHVRSFDMIMIKNDRSYYSFIPINHPRGNDWSRSSMQQNDYEYDEEDKIILEPKRNTIAYPHQTPHSGYHFDRNQRRWAHTIRQKLFRTKKSHQAQRFTEGWYYRLTLPDDNASFAIIVSIEDPGIHSPIRLVCIQIIGPNDEYFIRGTRDTTLFWAWKYQQGLGVTFRYYDHDTKNGNDTTNQYKQPIALKKEEWYRCGMVNNLAIILLCF